MLGGDHVRERVALGIEQLEKLEHDPRPAQRRCVGPGREGLPRGSHRRRHIGRIGQADPPGQSACGWVADGLAAFRAARTAPAGDVMIDERGVHMAS